VVTATLILSAVVVTVLGYILMQHLVAGIYANMQSTSQNIADAGLASAENWTQFSQRPNGSSRTYTWALAQSLKSTGGTPYAVEVTPLPLFQGAPVYGGGTKIGFYGQPKFPVALTNDVTAEWKSSGVVPKGAWRQWTSIAMAPRPQPVPGLLWGAPFGGGYALYYFFPLAAEQQTIASIQQSLLVAGIAVVFLLAAIAWLVTRWVPWVPTEPGRVRIAVFQA